MIADEGKNIDDTLKMDDYEKQNYESQIRNLMEQINSMSKHIQQ